MNDIQEKKHMKIEGDEYYQRFTWERAIVVLSLDISQYFTCELGIEQFYSAAVRESARDFLVEALEQDGEDAVWHTSPLEFSLAVSGKLGAEIVHEIEIWKQATFLDTDHEFHILYWEWDEVFRMLSEAWNNSSSQTVLPLDNANDTHIRLMIRDYLSRSASVHQEVERVRNYQIECENEDGIWIASYLSGAICDRLKCSLLHELSRVLSQEQIIAIRHWIQVTKGKMAFELRFPDDR